MKRYISKIILSLLIISLLAAGLTACAGKSGTEEAFAYVSLKINPEAELVVDGNGKVLSVNALNSDAEILLSDINLVGLSIEEATEAFVAAAAETGYLPDGEENVVTVTVVANEDLENSLNERIARSITKYFDNNGINGRVSRETLAQYADEAATLGVSVGKMKMIMRAIDMNPEAVLSELAEMPVKELIRLINTNMNDNVTHTARQQLKTEREQLKTEYADMFALSDEIEELEEQLTSFAGSEEERAALEEEIAAKKTELALLKAEYKAREEELLAEAKAQSQQIKAERKAEKEARKEQNRNKNGAKK